MCGPETDDKPFCGLLPVSATFSIGNPATATTEPSGPISWLMPMSEVLKLDSVWFDESGPVKVGDILPVVFSEISGSGTRQYPILAYSMIYNGWIAPVHISRDRKRLKDGIHRVAIAWRLRFTEVLVSHKMIRPEEWDNSEIGREYNVLWRKRIGLPA